MLVADKYLQVEWSTDHKRKRVEMKLVGDTYVFS
jgi:hypothetical protein